MTQRWHLLRSNVLVYSVWMIVMVITYRYMYITHCLTINKTTSPYLPRSSCAEQQIYQLTGRITLTCFDIGTACEGNSVGVIDATLSQYKHWLALLLSMGNWGH